MGEVLTVFLGVVCAGILGLEGSAGAGALVLPLLATQVLWINLVTDSAPALAMGVDPETDDVMARPPRPRTQSRHRRAHVVGRRRDRLVMAAVTLLTLDLYLRAGSSRARAASTTRAPPHSRCSCWRSSSTASIARSETTSAFHRLFVNGWLWAAVALSLLLQVAVVHVPVLNTAFGTVPLGLDQWAGCVGMASLVLFAAELRKAIMRRMR
jgi:magnesium-transporting ATPase (P-type)